MFKRNYVLIMLIAILVGYQNCKHEFAAQKPNYSIQIASKNSDNSTSVKPAAEWSNSLDKAMTIYQRLSTKVSLQHPDILKMKSLIEQNKLKEAALVATESDNFYNVVIRDFAAKMSNRELDPSAPLNDFTATIIGIARDDIDAREMLTGDFYYSGLKSSPLAEVERDIVRSNTHFQNMDSNFTNLRKALFKHPKQRAIVTGNLAELPDAAGVITSRAFMSAHAGGGTNRRLVEFSFNQFLCSEIDEWKTGTEWSYIGRDIPRGEPFSTKCSLCHGPMDAMRPAFAYVDFIQLSATDGALNYKKIYNDTNDSVEKFIPDKFRRASEAAPGGHKVRDSVWENLTEISPKNADYFKWRSAMNGQGMKDFGKMLSESRAFSKCMAKRAFETVCYESFPQDKALLERLADKFEEKSQGKNAYSLKNLFSEIVILKECSGNE